MRLHLRHGRFNHFALGLLGVLLLLIAACSTGSAASHEMGHSLAALNAADLIIYDDALASGWQDWSWSADVDFAGTDEVHSGRYALATDFTAPWAGLSFYTPEPLDTADYAGVAFWIHGGTGDARQLRLGVQQSVDYAGSTPHSFQAPAGEWTQIRVNWAALDNPDAITRISIQDDGGTNQPPFYVDELKLIGTGDEPTAPPTTPLTGVIQIDAAGPGTAFDPRVLGSNLPAWLNSNNLADSVFQARVAASGITVLRLPGGSWSNEYGWLSCERRRAQTNAAPCGPDNGWANWAARPTDFLDFLQATGTQGMWVVNPNGTPQEAAALVAFFNGLTTDTTPIGIDRNGFDWQTVGTWAQLRTDNGNPLPFGIQLWAVGNEVYAAQPDTGGAGCVAYGWEPFWSCDGGEYVTGKDEHEGYAAFRAAMQAVDPSIQVGAVGVPSAEFPAWNEGVFRAAGANMDYFDVHQYAYFDPPADYAQMLAQPQSVWAAITGFIRSDMQEYAGIDDIPLAITEYNLFSVGDRDTGRLMNQAVNALFIADTIGQMATHGIVMANQWDVANGPSSSGSEYGLLHVEDDWYRSPAYYAFVLWSQFGTTLLPVSSTLDAGDQLSLYGGRLESGSYTLLAINKQGAAISAAITVTETNGVADGLVTITGGTAASAAAAGPDALGVSYNGNPNPADDLSDAPAIELPPIAARKADIGHAADSATELSFEFAPYSITLLTLDTVTPPSAIYLPFIAQ